MDRDEEEEQLPTTENSPRGLHAAEPGCEVFEACGHLGLGETFVYLADISTQDSEAIWGGGGLRLSWIPLSGLSAV